MEMMPANAATLMQHRRQNLLAGRLLSMHQSTVPVAQLGDFILPFSEAEDLAIPHFYTNLNATPSTAKPSASSAPLPLTKKR